MFEPVSIGMSSQRSKSLILRLLAGKIKSESCGEFGGDKKGCLGVLPGSYLFSSVGQQHRAFYR